MIEFNGMITVAEAAKRLNRSIEDCELVALDGGIRQAAIENRIPVRLSR
jgi:hypothetical protein